MAIAFDAQSHGLNLASTSSVTVAHTCSGSDRVLVVCVASDFATTNYTGVTYNGVAMTKSPTFAFDPLTGVASAIYFLVSPSTGTHNIVFSVANGPWNANDFGLDAVSLTGCDTSSQTTSGARGAETSGTTASLDNTAITPSAATSWIVDCIISKAGITGPTDGTQLTKQSLATGVLMSASYKNPATTSAYTDPWAVTSGQWAVIALEIPAKASAWTSTLTEAATLTGVLLRTTSRGLVEGFTLNDVLSAIRVQVANLFESMGLTDLISRTTGRNLTENTTATDTQGKQTSRNLAEVFTLVDLLGKASVLLLLEVAAVSDTLIRDITHVLSEAATLAISGVRGMTKGLQEAFALADTFARLSTFGRTLIETLTVADLRMAFWHKIVRATDATYNAVVRAADSVYKKVTRHE